MNREIKVFDFVRVNDKGIKVVSEINNETVEVIGIELSEDEDTIICRSSVHHISEIEYVDETMVNIAGPLWLMRKELSNGSFERVVY